MSNQSRLLIYLIYLIYFELILDPAIRRSGDPVIFISCNRLDIYYWTSFRLAILEEKMDM